MNSAVYLLPCKPGSVYVNLGSDCLNDCRFCVKRFGRFYGQELAEEVPYKIIVEGLERIGRICDSKRCRPTEIVICGVGEPFLHYETTLKTCVASRRLFGKVPIRADTAGLWWARNKSLDFLEYIDSLSVSLNAESPEKYDAMCQPKIPGAYGVLMDFLHVLRDKADGKDVRLTIVDTSRKDFMPPRKLRDHEGDCPAPDIGRCKAIADALGFPLIVKELFRDSEDGCWNMAENEERLLSGEYFERCKGCNHRHI